MEDKSFKNYVLFSITVDILLILVVVFIILYHFSYEVNALEISEFSNLQSFKFTENGGSYFNYSHGLSSLNEVHYKDFPVHTSFPQGFTHIIIPYSFSSAIGTLGDDVSNRFDYDYITNNRFSVTFNTGYVMCDGKSTYMICSLPDNTNSIKNIEFQYSFYFSPNYLNLSGNIYGSFKLGTIFYLGNASSSSIQDSIDKQTEQQHKDSQAVKDAIEGDNLDTGSIESSKNDAFDAYNSAESNLNLGDSDLSSINLGLNPTVASKSWSTFERLRNVNPKVAMFFISMCSIGLIKLFLGR